MRVRRKEFLWEILGVVNHKRHNRVRPENNNNCVHEVNRVRIGKCTVKRSYLYTTYFYPRPHPQSVIGILPKCGCDFCDFAQLLINYRPAVSGTRTI